MIRFMLFLLFGLYLIVIQQGTAQPDKPAYRIFNHKAKAVTYTDMLKVLQQAEVVLFGELHNNSLVHWLEWEIFQDLTRAEPQLYSLGMEMFEADVQPVVDEYMQGMIRESYFTKEAKVWDNYTTDYRFLVEHARKLQIPLWATNIPRRYAHIVAYHGLAALDSLPEYRKAWMAPLPITIDMELRSYKQMLQMVADHGGHMQANYFVAAQAIKDATMAYRIVKALEQRPRIIHYHGSYHSDYQEGIAWYLMRYRPQTRYITISCVEQDQLDRLEQEHQGKADFLIVLPSNMHKSY